MQDRINILIADSIDLSNIKILDKKRFSVNIKLGIANSEILQSRISYNALIIRSTRIIDKAILSRCGLDLVATCSKGVDHIDVDYAKKKGIKIINCISGNHISAAEHTLGLILEIYKRISYSDALIRQGNFSIIDFERRELAGKKIGIIGVGKVGSHVAKLSEAFGLKIFANDIDKEARIKTSHLQFKSLIYILKHCDIIALHIPIDKKNYNFISKDKLDLISEKSIFINTSRGRIINEKHLTRLLKRKRIAFAGLDVFYNEPDINKEFFKLENVILTNHSAGKTIESRNRIAKDILMQVRNFYINFGKRTK
ncbi:MAG: hypothetical protein H8D45_01490 [Bacteroidetes bacterium]|nr:hypothetical protein [Bacteroidota bacterium]